MQTAAELRGVAKKYKAPGGGYIEAVRTVDLSIQSGAFTSLLGPSGCGKTTLLRIFGGFEQPDSGQVLLDGEDVTAISPNKRAVNTVFQSYALFPHMSVKENIGYGLSVSKVPKAQQRQRTNDAIDMVQLGDLADRRPDKLSGGQRQRVALARALVMRPKLLLLDEPLSALDRKLRREMQFELKRIQKESGITFLCVTHDQEEALAMSDTICVMRSGQVEQSGPPDQVYSYPASRFVAEFVGDMNFVQAQANGTDGSFILGDGQKMRSDRVNGHEKHVTLAIRPERFSLIDGSSAGLSTLRARVTGGTFVGSQDVIELELNGTKLHVIQDGTQARPAVGDTAHLSYEPADVSVFSS